MGRPDQGRVAGFSGQPITQTACPGKSSSKTWSIVMGIEIREVLNKRDLKRFVLLAHKIYKDSPYWVPPLIIEEMAILDRSKNPAFENAEARLFMACQDGEPAGCIAAILSHIANKKHGTRNMRFGWFETVEDYRVAEALFRAVEEYARDSGMETLTGPQGFSDMDREGLLIEGHETTHSFMISYHHPYYAGFLDRYGFEKEEDYVFYKLRPTSRDIFVRIADAIEPGRLRLVPIESVKRFSPRFPEMFHIYNEAYEDLYGTVPLTDSQIRYYIKKYISAVHKDLIKIVVDEQGQMAAFMIALSSLSEALQKARGRLLPSGWFHLLRALRTYRVLEIAIIGVKKKYQGSEAVLMMVADLLKSADRLGFEYGVTAHMLEGNTAVQALRMGFDSQPLGRLRIYKKRLD